MPPLATQRLPRTHAGSSPEKPEHEKALLVPVIRVTKWEEEGGGASLRAAQMGAVLWTLDGCQPRRHSVTGAAALSPSIFPMWGQHCPGLP